MIDLNLLRDGYKLKNGIIQNPGKFEGETVAALYYYDLYMDGCDTIFEILPEEREAFKVGEALTHVYIDESEHGFVTLKWFTSEREAELYEKACRRYEDDEESVELIASDYEWTCPDCETLNHEIEINEWVTCKECDHEYRVNEYHHAIG